MVVILITFVITAVNLFKVKSNNDKCDKYDTKTLSAAEKAEMNAWHIPNIDSEKSESLYGFSYAFKKIYENQNPADCKTAKFIIYSGYESGFGSSIHVESNYLSVAVDIGRVLIQPPIFAPLNHGAQWKFYNPLCYNKEDNTYIRNMYCYYEPYSKCNYNDIFPDYNNSDPSSWPESKIPIFEFQENEIKKSLEKNAAIMDEKVIRFKHGIYMTMQVSKSFEDILQCAGFLHGYDRQYWIVSVASSYLIRPNR